MTSKNYFLYENKVYKKKNLCHQKLIRMVLENGIELSKKSFCDDWNPIKLLVKFLLLKFVFF